MKPNIEWIEYKSFKKHSNIIHGTFLRHGGISQGSFATLNAGDATSDAIEKVTFNRELIAQKMGLTHLIFAHQNHGTTIHTVTPPHQASPHADALLTQAVGIGLAITHADCQAALFYDPVQQVIAAVHAGWRGLAQNIYGHLIAHLHSNLHCQPHNLLVAISPSLGPDHAEFKHYKEELPVSFWPFQENPYYFDLWAIAHQQLLAAGIQESNLEIARVCTACQTEDYFSYRKEKKTGRNVTVIALKYESA